MKVKNILTAVIFALIFSVASVTCFIKKDAEFSEDERRMLAQKTDFSLETFFSGEYAENFELYSADQFPFRDNFRTLKAVFSTKILNKAENNGLYFADGHLSKLEYPEDENMTKYAAERFNYIYEKFLKDTETRVYFSVIPDKNYFLAEKNGYPSIDYPKMTEHMRNETKFAEYIDIFPLLDIDDYYRTDSHWRQEKITGVAKYLAEEMGAEKIRVKYTVKTLEKPFYGVYSGQSALPTEADEIKYLTNETLENAVVKYYGTGVAKKGDMYDMEKADGKDPYEMFLSGSMPILTIENPNSKTNKELIILRDSFGSSLAPLISQRYKKTTVVDIRYIRSEYLSNFIDFQNQDVLFIYSTTMLNNGTALQ